MPRAWGSYAKDRTRRLYGKTPAWYHRGLFHSDQRAHATERRDKPAVNTHPSQNLKTTGGTTGGGQIELPPHSETSAPHLLSQPEKLKAGRKGTQDAT